MQPEIDLSGLRDLHVLSEPDFWPLAIGWWVVLVGIFLSVICFIVSYKMWRERPIVYACRKARKIAKEDLDDLAYLKKVERLLKRVAMAVDGREKIAPLCDVSWQNFLETRVADVFTKEESALIAFAPYEMTLSKQFNKIVLAKHTLVWIKKIFKNKKSS